MPQENARYQRLHPLKILGKSTQDGWDKHGQWTRKAGPPRQFLNLGRVESTQVRQMPSTFR